MKVLRILALAAALGACSETPPPAARPVPGAALETIVVQPAAVPREMAFDGVVEAINQATVAAQTGGRVVELPYDVGDYVEKDAVIVRITGTEQRARTGAAEATRAEARARLEEAQLAYNRARNVYERGLIAKAQLDKAAADLDAARARVEATQASVAEAREGLGYTVIRAPYAGIVVARHVRLGETVAPGKPLMTGLSLEHLRVAVEIPQQHIGPLRKHRKARVILPDGGYAEAAELRIPPNADPATHTFRVLVTLAPGEHGVFPGTLVKVAFVQGEVTRVAVPEAAMVRRGELVGVYVVGADNTISLRYVRAGTPTGDGRVPVLAGLAGGERIATDPIAAGIAYKQQTQAAPQPVEGA